LGARAGSQRLRSGSLAGGLSGPLDIVARLVQLAPFLCHPRLVFGTVHALAQLVHVREHLLLLLLEAFQAPPNFLAFFLRPRLLQSRLKLFEPIVQILLPAGQLLQPIHRLQLLAPLGGLRRLRLALAFIAVLGLGQIHLLELALHLLAAAAALLIAAPIAHDLVLVLLHLEQGLGGSLLGGQRLRERGWRIRRLVQSGESLLHFCHRRGPKSAGAPILLLLRSGFGLVERGGLGIANHDHVVLVTWGFIQVQAYRTIGAPGW